MAFYRLSPLLFLAMGFASQFAAAAPSFRGLGLPPGTEPYGYTVSGLSADGTVIVGTMHFSNATRRQGFTWTSSDGFQLLPYLQGFEDAEVSGISADGRVVIGLDTFKPGRALRWVDRQPLALLEPLESIRLYLPRGVSADGSVIVGDGFDAESRGRAYRWSSASGLHALDLGPRYNDAVTADVSADGSVIVGVTDKVSDGLPGEVFRWSEVEGVKFLGTLAPNAFIWPHAVSADGSTIVGLSQRSDGAVADPFSWTAKDGFISLGNLPGADFGLATDVSGDGSLIVGSSYPRSSIDGFRSTFLWDRINGVRPLQDVLALEYGLDLTGWALLGGAYISVDGTTIIGDGINPQGVRESYVAVIPEPHLSALLCATLFFTRRLRCVMGPDYVTPR